MDRVTVGDTVILPTWTFAATGAYSLTGSTVVVTLWLGRIHAPTFAIEKLDTDDSVSWDTGTGELEVTIEPEDWGAFAPVKNGELSAQVEITLASGEVKTFAMDPVPYRDQAH